MSNITKFASQLREMADEAEAMQKQLAGVIAPASDKMAVVTPVRHHRIRRSRLTRLRMSASQFRHSGNKEKLAAVEQQIAKLAAVK